MTNQELLQIYSAYLPYGVKVMFEGEELEHSLVGLDTTSTPLKLISSYGDYGQASFEFSKLVLRPLSDLTKEIEHNGEKFVPLIKMGLPNKTSVYNDITYVIKKGHTPYIEMQKLLEWHFDVFSTIDQKLAINLNEVK